MEKSPLATYNALNAYKIIQNLNKRNMAGYYCETKQEALEKALSLIPPEAIVSWGGSQSILEIGLLSALKMRGNPLLDRDSAATPEEREAIQHRALSCDYYLMSANAVTMDGKLINIDRTGNRLAALIYGPKNVLVIAGMNKVEPDEAAGMARARNHAAPINAIRVQAATPCATTGQCQDCTVEECICSQVLITRMSQTKNRIKVILAGESLGF